MTVTFGQFDQTAEPSVETLSDGTESAGSVPVLESGTAKDPFVVGSLADALAGHAQAAALFGGGELLPLMVRHVRFLRAGFASTSGVARQRLILTCARYAEFAGWLSQDLRCAGDAQFWTDHALEWAREAGDPAFVSYVLMRQSDLAEGRDPARRVLDLADAAARVPALGSRARALVIQQRATGYALDRDVARFERTVEEAQEGVEAGAPKQRSSQRSTTLIPRRQEELVPQFITTVTSADAGRQGAEIAVLPVGSFEQHADFLPLATDTLVASLIAERIAADYNLFLLPPVTISCSHEHAAFPGTVSLSAATLAAVIGDIRQSLRAHGIGKLAVVNAHGGNYVLSNVVMQANAGGRSVTLFPVREDWDRARQDAGCTGTTSQDMHAGELEVSLLLHADPRLVGETRHERDHLAAPRPFLLVTGMTGYTETGVIGLPSHGTAAKGLAILDSLSRSFAAHFELLSQPADTPSH